MKTEPNDPATGYSANEGSHSYPGLTKRERFAAMAMQGMLANNWIGYSDKEPECEELGRIAVNFADALIAALNKNETI